MSGQERIIEMREFVIWQRVEGALVFAAGLGLYGLAGADLAWSGALLLFFVPDLSFAAYGLGPRIGSVIYNGVHVYAFGAVLLALGGVLGLPLVAALGALWLAHSGFDRMLGYGLKSTSSFQDTHLGRIGKTR
ncbi:DUF4260 domain-containing protein [Devosia sp. CAU 1758]